MLSALLLAALSTSGNSVSDVVYLSAKVLRGEVPTTGRLARMPSRTVQFERMAGELGLEGWLGDGVLLLSDGREKDAKELLVQAVLVRSAVLKCSPAQPLPTRDAPLVVFHVRKPVLYRGVLARLAAVVPDHDELLAGAAESSGFQLAEPLLCVVCADPAATGGSTKVELRKNLLVHLAAHAFFDAGFGAAPEWLREGFALDVEADLCGEPEAFCRRGPHELVRAGSRKSDEWTRRLAAEWRDADDARFADLFMLSSDVYAEAAAWRALALVRWIRRHRAAKLLEVVDAMADAQKASWAGSLPSAENAALQARGLESALGPKWRGEFLAGIGGSAGPADGGRKQGGGKGGG
jgi:hypothetical protein